MENMDGRVARKAIIGVIVAVVLIGAGSGYAIAARYGERRYEHSVESVAEAKHELDQAIAAGQRVLDGYQATQLKNPQLTADLDQTLMQAKTLDAPNGTPNRWLLWETNAASTDNERYASDAKAMAALVKRGANEVKASFNAKQSTDGKQSDTVTGKNGQSTQGAKTGSDDHAASAGERYCAAFAATYAMYQGGSAVTVHDDCGMTANGGGEPSATTELAYVPQSFVDNGDGTCSWQVDSTGTVTYYPAGVHAPAFDEFHASAGVADPTVGTDRLVVGGGGAMYVRND